MSDVRQISTFFVQDLFFGVEVLQVQEIIRRVTITRVPLAPPRVGGLINLRGQIVTAIDLRRCLDLPERPPGQTPAGLILQAEEGLVGLIVDEIGTVFELPENAFEPPPEILKGVLFSLPDPIVTETQVSWWVAIMILLRCKQNKIRFNPISIWATHPREAVEKL